MFGHWFSSVFKSACFKHYFEHCYTVFVSAANFVIFLRFVHFNFIYLLIYYLRSNEFDTSLKSFGITD